jgi:hypothetical protein
MAEVHEAPLGRPSVHHAPLQSTGDQQVRLIAVLLVGIVAGLFFSNGVPAGFSLGAVSSVLPLGLRGTAIVSFGLTIAVVVLLTVVSQGGFRTGELSTAVPSFFAFYAFFFGMVYLLFA